LNRVGNTPIVQLESLSKGNLVYFAKLEGNNPFGSLKDRAALWMIKDAEEKGILKKDIAGLYRRNICRRWKEIQKHLRRTKRYD